MKVMKSPSNWFFYIWVNYPFKVNLIFKMHIGAPSSVFVLLQEMFGMKQERKLKLVRVEQI